MTSAQKATHRKKRKSKHVLKAKEEREKQDTASLSVTDKAAQKKNTKRKRKMKDPSEAASYLSLWKQRNAGGTWKFNKNTQSWLLRHMYHPEKVSKTTFTLLLEYLDGLQGATRTRAKEDARRRAMRYKEFEQLNEEASSQIKKTDVDSEKGEEQVNDKSDEIIMDEDDETRWKRLTDHEKRKEYKRARKVLEVLKD